MDIEMRLKAEQHSKLQELQVKLGEVLDCEPVDSGDDEEDYIWKQANDLKNMLDAFLRRASMRIDRFTKGQTAYVLGDGNTITVTSKKEPVEVTVLKIDRKYVTVTTGGRWEMQFEETFIEALPYLRENTDRGAPRLLFPSSDAVAEYLEREDLKRWVQQAAGWDKISRYTLEQLRAVRRILEGEQKSLKR